MQAMGCSRMFSIALWVAIVCTAINASPVSIGHKLMRTQEDTRVKRQDMIEYSCFSLLVVTDTEENLCQGNFLGMVTSIDVCCLSLRDGGMGGNSFTQSDNICMPCPRAVLTVITFTEIDYRLALEDTGNILVKVEVRSRGSFPTLFLRVLPQTPVRVFQQINARTLRVIPDIAAEVNELENFEAPRFANDADFDSSPISLSIDTPGDYDVLIPVTNDTIYEPEQIFIVLLEALSTNSAIPVIVSSSVCRIVDDDFILLSWDRPSYTYPEGTETVDLPVAQRPIIKKQSNMTTEYRLQIYAQPYTLRDPSINEAEWSESDRLGRRIDNDFAIGTTALRGVVRLFISDEDLQSIDVTVYKDQVYNEGREVVGMEFVNTENQPEFVYGRFKDATLVIVDTSLTVGFEREFTMASEGVGVFQLCVQIIDPSLPVSSSFMLARPFSLEVMSVSETADQTLDFLESIPGSITFETDNSTHRQCLNVTLVDDMEFEFTEEFMISLTLMGDPDEQSVVVDPSVSRVQIVDNDMVTIGFENIEYTVVESAQEVTLVVSLLAGETSTPVSVILTTLNGSAVSGIDFSPRVLTLIFDEVTNSINITIPIIVNIAVEEDEIFSASLSLVGPLEFGSKITVSPSSATVVILDDSLRASDIRVNDTIIGDPLYTVPLRVTNLMEVGLDENVSLCYEVHGEPDKYFNLVSDICISVNAHYQGVDVFNVIDHIGITAVDTSIQCRKILVSVEDGCSASVDGMTIESSYNDRGISVRRYPQNRVRVSVPNCAHRSLVMWMICQNSTLTAYDSNDNPIVSMAAMMKFVIARGFNLQERSHGILGQFWNIPITIESMNSRGDEEENTYTIKISHPDSITRSVIASYYSRTWEVVAGNTIPCLYAGSYQAGHVDGSDSVIQGSYKDYIVDNAFEIEYLYSKFETGRCN